MTAVTHALTRTGNLHEIMDAALATAARACDGRFPFASSPGCRKAGDDDVLGCAFNRDINDCGGYFYLQVFHGYGETLLNYNQNAGIQLSVGLGIVR